jgi:hypothetical protein
LIVELQTRVILLVPIDLLQVLCDASENEVREVELWLDGFYLHWEKLDVDFRVSSLIQGIFGTKRWMWELSAKFKEMQKEKFLYKFV